MTRPVVFAVAVFAAAMIVYLATLPPDILPGDSGELVAASYTLSIAHPPGFPLYLMLGKIFSSVFAIGSIAYRYNLLSAVMASAAAGLGVAVLARLGVGSLLGAIVAFGLATGGAYWLQATTGDVYTLNGLFTALMFYLALLGRRHGEWALVALAFVGGLAISHHLTLVYGLASALLVLLLSMEVRPRVGAVAVSVFFFCLGLTVWLYIPIRSSQAPQLSWGDTSSFRGFLDHITAQTYKWRLRTFDPGHRIVDLARYFKVLVRTAGVPLTALACAGVVLNARRRRLAAGFLLLIIFYAGHFVVYSIPDIESHIFPALVAVAVLAALGLERISGWPRLGRAGPSAALALAGIVVAVNLAALHPRQDQWLAGDYARAVQQSAIDACGTDGILVCSGDVSFPLLYEAYTGASPVRTFFVGMSDPRRAGLEERPATLDGWIAALAGKYGASKVALFGAAPPYALGRPTRICGLVHVIGEAAATCASPLDFTVRGAGQDLRDYGSRLLSADYYLLVARWYVQEKDRAGAGEYVTKAMAAGYDDVTTFVEAARVYRSLGMAADAKRALQEALKMDPDFFETHNMLADLALGEGNAGEAIAEYKQALKGNPNPGPLYSNLGGAYLASGDYDDAIRSYNKAIALDSTLVNAYVGVGRALEGQGRVEEALAWYDRGRRLDRTSEPAAHAEASLLLKAGKYQEARMELRESLDAGLRGPLLLSDLGLAFLREGLADSAIAYLKQALASDPSMLTARGNLAVAYEARGLTAEAIEQYRLYLEAAPPGPLRDRAARALGDLQRGK